MTGFSPRVLVGALTVVALCNSVLGEAEEAADTPKAESCETEKPSGILSGWIVLQWTLVMALARCVGLLCVLVALTPF